MGKHDFFSPKAIANRQKSKGLQKLRWYCQMCEKQCRDENGFKCHIQSESHQRQMGIFASNAGRIVDSFSSQFKNGFLKILSSRVMANTVYQEYISEKTHLHMNATRWSTLSGFVQYLGREGLCRVEEGERGWWISWIDNSPESLARQEAIQKMDRMKKDQAERDRKLIEDQIERGKSSTDASTDTVYTELRRDEDEKIRIELVKPAAANGFAQAVVGKQAPAVRSVPLKNLASSAPSISSARSETESVREPKRKMTAIEEIMQSELGKKARFSDGPQITPAKQSSPQPTKHVDSDNYDDGGDDDEQPWLSPGLIVKIMSRKLQAGALYKQKARVSAMDTEYVATLQLLSDQSMVRLDQADLETVIPNIDGRVRMVLGPHKGREGALKEVVVDRFIARIHLDGDVGITEHPYEHFCKIDG